MDSWRFESSYYEASVSRPPLAPSLRGEAQADTVVIGGGFTGLSCALELAQRGREVVLLEAKAVGWGASGRNGGQLIHGFAAHDLAAIAKAAQVSEKQLFDMSLEAIALINQRVAAHQIACDLQHGHAEAAVKPRHLRDLYDWAEKADKEYNYPHNRVLEAAPFREIITSRAYCGGLLNDISGHLHPLKYALGLAQAARAAGVRIYENSRVEKVVENADGLVVHSAEGTVRCRRLLVACNAYVEGLMPQISSRVMPVGTYIAATEPLGEEADNLITDNRGICNSNFVLDYYRLSADKRLLFGGRASYSTRSPGNLSASLRGRMLSVFPQLQAVKFDYVWGGYVAITMNRFPDIGRLGKHTYYAQGFSGHGVALTGYAGKLIADAMCGEEEKFEIFNRVRHPSFPGGRALRTPILVLAMLYYRLRDLM